MIELAFEDVIVDHREDSLPPLNLGLYEAFLSQGAIGRDALAIYLHLLYAYRRQGTNRPWATNQYIQNGLGMGERKVRVAKSLLAKMNLISAVQQRDATGRVVKTYTSLHLLPNPGPSTHAKTARVESTDAESALVEEISIATTPAVTARVDSCTGGPGPEVLEEEMNSCGKNEEERERFHESRDSAPDDFDDFEASHAL